MQLIRNLDELPERFCHGAVSIGNFDGVHRGHARLVGRLVEVARQMQAPAVVFTFDPHPVQVLHPETAPTPLGWTERNAELLHDMNVDAVIAYPTDRTFLQLKARSFFEEIVRGRLKARAMVEGRNFFFGHDRVGTVDLLRQFCTQSGLRLEVVEPVVIGDAVVSSSRIRSLVCSGRVAEARSLLGRPHRIRGVVARGAGRGATLGHPTANLERLDTLLPAEGIYAARVEIDGDSYPTAVSIGPNPTFGEGSFKVEAYLIGYDGLLYDRTMELDFVDRLRDIKRFDSPDALVAQMQRDVAAVRGVVEEYE